MLNDEGIDFEYREYTQEPLSKTEIKNVLALLKVEPAEVLRKNDKAYKELGLTAESEEETLVRAMSEHPTLLQRPIGVFRGKAAVGRPPEKLLELVAD